MNKLQIVFGSIFRVSAHFDHGRYGVNIAFVWCALCFDRSIECSDIIIMHRHHIVIYRTGFFGRLSFKLYNLPYGF